MSATDGDDETLTAVAKAIAALDPMRCGDDPWKRENTFEHGLSAFGRKSAMRDATGFVDFLAKTGFEVRRLKQNDPHPH